MPSVCLHASSATTEASDRLDEVMLWAARRAREDAGLAAGPAGRAGAGEAAQLERLFLLWMAKSKDVWYAG